MGAIYEESRNEGFDLVSEPMTGCLLRTLVSSKPGGSFLELGTGTGAATAWILDGMDLRSSLVTVENDPWPGKYDNLESALGLLKEGGFYVVDMDPQATWPPGHEAKVAALLHDLTARRELRLTKLSWASGIVIATRG